jgi:predicted dithiol-disulfide oxidoreductase (DUF899 family)
VDAKTETLTPAAEIARQTDLRFPNESPEYRAARTALLAEEIELRRLHERVAAQRRALPPGGAVTGDYQFDTEAGQSDLASLFGDKETLLIYSFMFGPQRARPCPMCVNHLGGWESSASDLAQQLSLVVVARSPLERLIAWKQERGWENLRLVSDLNGNFSRDYFGVRPDGSEDGGTNVFTRRDGTVRHFWSSEMTDISADPGQDPRGDLESPLWQILDLTPGGRQASWYPKLQY